MNISSRYTCINLLRNSWNTAVINHWNVEGALQSPICMCFESIKTLACKAPILKPIDYDNPDPIWVITDGSKAGVGAIYGQGPNWKTCRPARFMSKKFSNAQQHYQTHEHETIAMLKALMEWEDKLLGHKFTLVTDHKGLKYFETQKNL